MKEKNRHKRSDRKYTGNNRGSTKELEGKLEMGKVWYERGIKERGGG